MPRREEVIQAIYDRYGRNHAGLTAAVTSYRARSAGREVAKAFGLPADNPDRLSNAVGGWWTEALKVRDARLAGINAEDPAIRAVLRHAAMLAAFRVISPIMSAGSSSPANRLTRSCP